MTTLQDDTSKVDCTIPISASQDNCYNPSTPTGYFSVSTSSVSAVSVSSWCYYYLTTTGFTMAE